MAAYAYVLMPLCEEDASEAIRAQRQAIDAYVAAGGLAIDEWFCEAPGDCFEHHGKRRERFLFNRPAGKRLAAALQPGDWVFVADPFALGMGMAGLYRLLCELDDHSAALRFPRLGHLIVDGAINALACRIMRGLLQSDLEAAAEDAREGLRKSKARGGPSGGQARVGWKHVGKGKRRRVVPDEQQRETMRLIVELKNAGLTFYAIAKRLQKERHFWRKPKANAPRGYTPEQWDHKRVERGYEEMRRVMAGNAR